MAPFFIGLLSVLLGIVSVLIVLVVLMQRPKQEGLGAAFGGGMTDQMFGAQTTNVLQKGTVYLAVMFFVFSLILSVLTAKSVREDSSTIDALKDQKVEEEVAPTIPNGSATTPPVQVTTTPIEVKEPAETEKPAGESEPEPEVEAEPAEAAAEISPEDGGEADAPAPAPVGTEDAGGDE